ncbi:MAG: deoxyribodipyrimidine photo-lyase [Bdellovibrionaceae bacterium]|nr:deoxyribodipyrimidine photo-lyase [Pseudobdellovibrionaceae bacterium]
MGLPKEFGIHWFRRDLRIAGNGSLLNNWKENKGNVLGVFCFDSQFLSRPDFSHNRFGFFMETLRSVRDELRAAGGDLLVIDELPHVAFPKLIDYFKQSKTAKLNRISYNRDYEPFARARDQKVEDLVRAQGITIVNERDHLIIEPEELNKGKMGEYYQVYSPFAKKWFDIFQTPEIQKRISSQKTGLSYLFSDEKKTDLFNLQWKDVVDKSFPYVDTLEHFQKENQKNVNVPIPPSGSRAVREALESFKNKIKPYKENRDVPSITGTSRFSLFLKNGSLTTAQVVQYMNLQNMSYKTEDGPARFLKELVWREFYYHILYHRPDVEQGAFLTKYNNIPWENNKKWFDLWCKGQTGFPIVDAGMRELNTTGWMHNRVRMIVASFLIKDLLIDWRWGEKYFMEKLLDGDLAPNNGGWQWAASTGCDAQPYFRIFNPWLQSQRFDPDGTYIRRYIPELKNISNKALHKEDENRSAFGYPKPILVHADQKPKALALFK